MKKSVIRILFEEARQHARRIADRCDFSTAKRIGKAAASFGGDFVVVCVSAKGQVEVAQIICAYAYGATLTGLSFQRSTSDEVVRGGWRLVTMTLSCCDGKGGK